MTEPEPFGYLLTLDLYGCKAGVCDDLNVCDAFLKALVDELGMTRQSPPFLFRSPPEYPEKAGLSGWVPLIESGIQIHTLTPKNFISLDVYSCGKFTPNNIIALAREFFDCQAEEMNFVLRGVRYHEIT